MTSKGNEVLTVKFRGFHFAGTSLYLNFLRQRGSQISGRVWRAGAVELSVPGNSHEN
jgi:hypothetical protein